MANDMLALNLIGKTAIVTGASQGLGLATATCLHSAGANIIVNYFPDPVPTPAPAPDANAVLAPDAAPSSNPAPVSNPTPVQGNAQQADALVASLGKRAIAVAADICSDRDVEQLMAAAVDSFGGLDILINNAGVLRDRTVKKMQFAEWQTVIDTNLTGVFRTCQAASRVMRDEGRIVNLASISALVGFFGQANYAASKAGVIGLTRVLSRELASRQITVNAVAPGVVLTEMGKSIPEASRADMLAQIPLGRFGTPNDIAHAILFLCSPLADYITGQTLHVNGGWIG